MSVCPFARCPLSGVCTESEGYAKYLCMTAFLWHQINHFYSFWGRSCSIFFTSSCVLVFFSIFSHILCKFLVRSVSCWGCQWGYGHIYWVEQIARHNLHTCTIRSQLKGKQWRHTFETLYLTLKDEAPPFSVAVVF